LNLVGINLKALLKKNFFNKNLMKNKEKVFKASNFLTFILKYITIEFNLE